MYTGGKQIVYYLLKLFEFLQIRGTIALISFLLLTGTVLYTNNVVKDNEAKAIKISEYAAIVASYKSVVSNDAEIAKAQSSQCAALVKEQVKAALEATPVIKGEEPFFKIDGLVK